MNKKIAAISLGCDKNRVDTENMLYLLTEEGCELTRDPNEADYILVNTCGFIESAKKESIEAVLEMAEYKKQGKKLIITGCLSQRYGKELFDGIAEADAVVGVHSESDIVGIIKRLENGGRTLALGDTNSAYPTGRVLTTPYHYAYLRIADGCDNRCSYCAIPYIRGGYRSAAMPDLIKEARWLTEQGAKELILVAQDTAPYGRDLYGRPMLKELLSELCGLDVWKLRLMYAYPESVDEELINIISKEDKIAKYIDIPLQHIDDAVLKRMNRRSGGDSIDRTLSMIKSINPDIAVRSTFIAGFDGESEQAFAALKDYLAATENIDYAGFFAYSPEEGTPAMNRKDGRLPKRVREARAKELERLWSSKTVENQKRYVGGTLEAVYEGIDFDRQRLKGRTQYNAPEIDTKIYLEADFPLEIGRVYTAEVYDSDFDLYGKIKEDDR